MIEMARAVADGVATGTVFASPQEYIAEMNMVLAEALGQLKSI